MTEQERQSRYDEQRREWDAAEEEDEGGIWFPAVIVLLWALGLMLALFLSSPARGEEPLTPSAAVAVAWAWEMETKRPPAPISPPKPVTPVTPSAPTGFHKERGLDGRLYDVPDGYTFQHNATRAVVAPRPFPETSGSGVNTTAPTVRRLSPARAATVPTVGTTTLAPIRIVGRSGGIDCSTGG